MIRMTDDTDGPVMLELELPDPYDAPNWHADNERRASELFPNAALRINAALLAAVHPRGIQYLEQAPVLALAAGNGHSITRDKERSHAARLFGERCSKGLLLRDMMAAYGLASQLRRVSGVALCPKRWPVLARLGKAKPQQLAQIIPDQSRRQLALFRALDRLLRPHLLTRADFDAKFLWAAQAISAKTDDPRGCGQVTYRIRDLRDFMFADDQAFDLHWTWDQARAAEERWHADLARTTMEQNAVEAFGVGWDDEIDYGDLPKAAEAGGFRFVALQSPSAIHAEGKAMHHCVASYIREVAHGDCRLYSVQRDDRRLATLELQVRRNEKTIWWSRRQLKAARNRAPSTRVKAAAVRFLESINTKPMS